MNAGRRILEGILRGTIACGLGGLLLFNYGCGKRGKEEQRISELKIDKATGIYLPLEKLDIKTYSETAGSGRAEKENLNFKVENEVLEINYNILPVPRYVWLEIDARGIDVSSMNFLYLKVSGGVSYPSKVKFEIGSKSEKKDRRLGVYIIGKNPEEKISSDEWTGIEIPMTKFKERDSYSDPNLVYSGLSDKDLKNLDALFFVFSDTFNHSEENGTLFVKDIVFSKEKLEDYMAKE